jgi:hypothetical protein
MHAIRASARHTRALQSTASLLAKLRVESVFVGTVARAAWLGDPIEDGSIDALALMNAPQKNQVAMMASNNGYRVERDEIEASVELDLVPLNFVDPEGDVRVHVLLASNALYGRMVTGGVEAETADRRLQIAEGVDSVPSSEPGASPAIRDLHSAIPTMLRVPNAEDFALLLVMSEDEEGVARMCALGGFDRDAFNERLVAIGLGAQVVRA